jgi:uncharacterized protein YkwD
MPTFAKKTWILLAAVCLSLTSCEQAVQQFPSLSRLSQRQPEASPSPAQSPATAQMEAAVRQRINDIRQKHGLKTLQNNERLAQVARNYSQKMAQKNFFGHVSPDGSTLVQRIQSARINYWFVGENLFKSVNISDPVPASIDGWMNSPGHRENILRPEFAETGVGVWRQGNTFYFTQLFLRSPGLPW